MMGFTFNGVHSSARFIKSIKSNPVIVPEKKHSFVEIPNKSSSILIRDASKRDVEESIQCWYERPSTMSARAYGRLLDEWFTTSNWQQLIFDDDSDYYRQALPISSITLDDIRLASGTFTIVFRCNPTYEPITDNTNTGGDGI